MRYLMLLVALVILSGCAGPHYEGYNFFEEIGREHRITPRSVAYLLRQHPNEAKYDPCSARGESLFDVRKKE